MVCINHGAVSPLLLHRSNEKLLRYLDVRRPEAPLECRPFLFGENVASLDGDNLSRRNRLLRKQTFALNRTGLDFRLWRTIGQISHYAFLQYASLNGCECQSCLSRTRIRKPL